MGKVEKSDLNGNRMVCTYMTNTGPFTNNVRGVLVCPSMSSGRGSGDGQSARKK